MTEQAIFMCIFTTLQQFEIMQDLKSMWFIEVLQYGADIGARAIVVNFCCVQNRDQERIYHKSRLIKGENFQYLGGPSGERLRIVF